MKTVVQPVVSRTPGTTYECEGVLGDYLRATSAQWLKVAPFANPGMLEMFRDRNRRPYRDQVPWAGEFAGKYLTAAVQSLRLTDDAELRDVVQGFVRELVALQAPDGYLGPWPDQRALTNQGTWDTWGHYHVMVGLLLWYEETRTAAALRCARRIGDLLCRKFLGKVEPRLVETGSTEMNLAPAHGLAWLYRYTRDPRHLALARQLVDEEFGARNAEGHYLAGNWLEGTLAGLEFFQLPKPRWESLHPIMALMELHWLTGEERYRAGGEGLWRSMARTDRHNNGGFTSGERACGNPFAGGAIETCCTIAWLALSVEVLKLTGSPRVADELELATLNSVTGMHNAAGRWATYNTPMDGVRRASAHDIVFQSREGTPELNCCSVNSVRGLGLVSEWALMQGEEGLYLNWYGPGRMTAPLAKDFTATLVQTTDYPWDGCVSLAVQPSKATEFTLHLRIPRWSAQTKVRVNGEAVCGGVAGTYLALRRKWRRGDVVELDFDFTWHTWVGHRECAGRASLYRGPILLAWDRRYNEMDGDDVPEFEVQRARARRVTWRHWLPPRLLLEFAAVDGRPVRLCDYGSAGAGGTPYRSWLPVRDAATLKEYFSPTPEEMTRADLGIYAADYVAYRDCLAWTPPKYSLGVLKRLRNGWPALLERVARARQATPDETAGGPSITAALARLDELGITAANFPERLCQEERELRLRHQLPAPLTTFTCSDLQPALPDIRQAALPATGLKFSPVTTVTDEDFIDIREFHHGQDGLLYLRGTVTRDQAGPGELRYGADGPVKVWVNGREVSCEPGATNPATAHAFGVPVVWQQGANDLVFALNTNRGLAWGIFAGLPLT